LHDLGRQWADAQQRGDTQTLDALATTDFVLVGPGGAVLDKQQWLDRYRSGDLVTRSLAWDQVDVRGHGTTAVAVGRHSQRAAYQGNTHDGDFRVTLVGLQIEGQWRLIAMHLSPISLPRSPTEEQAT
jgi:ketosteroid isomerase-like protein